jgi:hypothetical protein
MRVLKKNVHVDLATGRRTDQWVGDGQVVDVYYEPLTAAQLLAVKEFERTMKEEVIPEIERVMRMRAQRAQESRHWLIA